MVMPKGEYEIFEALNLFFEVVMGGLRGLFDGHYYFDTIAEDAFFEFRYRFPGWPLTSPSLRRDSIRMPNSTHPSDSFFPPQRPTLPGPTAQLTQEKQQL